MVGIAKFALAAALVASSANGQAVTTPTTGNCANVFPAYGMAAMCISLDNGPYSWHCPMESCGLAWLDYGPTKNGHSIKYDCTYVDHFVAAFALYKQTKPGFTLPDECAFGSKNTNVMTVITQQCGTTPGMPAMLYDSEQPKMNLTANNSLMVLSVALIMSLVAGVVVSARKFLRRDGAVEPLTSLAERADSRAVRSSGGSLEPLKTDLEDAGCE
jgi:hypothetical protein